MNEKQAMILSLCRRALAQGEEEGDAVLLQLDDDALARRVFYSYRGEGVNGGSKLRLTFFGLGILGQVYDTYEVKFRKGYVFNTASLMVLERLCRMPYWLDHKAPRLIVFDEQFHAHAEIVQGDIALMHFSHSIKPPSDLG